MKPYFVLCIFHKEKTPSMRIWPNGFFRCYGCNENGYVEEFDNLSQEFDRRRMKYLEQMGQLLLAF